MPAPNAIRELLRRRETGGPLGVYSACTAHPQALRACLARAVARGEPLLVEATANQVDQRGGYTGLTPDTFARFVRGLASEAGLAGDRLWLGGDHLGPLTFRKLPAEEAMREAETLVRAYVLAGFCKVHLDTSMALGDDDPSGRLAPEVMAERAARLAAVAEAAHAELLRTRPDAAALCYVVGSEVPIPGGAVDDEALQITRPEDLRATVETFAAAFRRRGLAAAWEQVVAVVVQPGVEFGDEAVHEYDRGAARALTAALRPLAPLVFEGHSTDYQRPAALRALVEDGVAILKVGPALTFALREGLLALEAIEAELLHARPDERSGFSAALEAEMLRDPSRWAGHHRGDPEALRLKRRFSLSDRARYYLPAPPVAAAVERLLANLSRAPIPLPLVSQYLPVQHARVREGTLAPAASALLLDRVGDAIDPYLAATRPARAGPRPEEGARPPRSTILFRSTIPGGST